MATTITIPTRWIKPLISLKSWIEGKGYTTKGFETVGNEIKACLNETLTQAQKDTLTAAVESELRPAPVIVDE